MSQIWLTAGSTLSPTFQAWSRPLRHPLRLRHSHLSLSRRRRRPRGPSRRLGQWLRLLWLFSPIQCIWRVCRIVGSDDRATSNLSMLRARSLILPLSFKALIISFPDLDRSEAARRLHSRQHWRPARKIHQRAVPSHTPQVRLSRHFHRIH